MHLTLPQVPEPLKIWEKIEIVVADGDEKGLYLARIEDFTKDYIVISNPEFREGTTLLRDHCEVVVLVVREDAVYQFYSLMSKKESRGQVLFTLSLPQDIRRVQRRQFVRVEFMNDVSVSNLGAESIRVNSKWFKTVCVNISGGGMLVKSTEEIGPPNILLVRTGLFDELGIEQPVAAICRRSFSQRGQRYCGIEFIRNDNLPHHFYQDELQTLPSSVSRFDHQAQNKLVTYIFQKQIELRKKGLI